MFKGAAGIAPAVARPYIEHRSRTAKISAEFMLKAAFRAISLFCLAVALVAGVLDITRTIANSEAILTPLGNDWADYGPASLAAVKRMFEASLPGFLWDPAALAVLRAPTWAVFAALTLLFAWLAKPARRRWQDNFR